MTPITAAIATSVVAPEISISQRTFATMRAAAGSSGCSSSADGLLMASTAGRSEKLIVAAAEAGERLDRVLAARVADLSRSRHKALILAGRVAIDGATIRDPGHRVNAGATIVLELPPPEDAEIGAEDIPLAGRVRGRRAHRHRQAGRARRPSGRRQLDRHAGQRADRPLRREPFRDRRRQAARHRASPRQGHHRPDGGRQDRPRPPRAQPRSSPTTAAPGRLRRGYLAFVWGAPDRPRGTIDKPIDRHPRARDKMAVREGGREAITHWEVLERYRGTDGKPVASLLACRLETGRTHQIRVHLAAIGHPLLGDDVYGPGFKTKIESARARRASSPGGPWQTGPACLSIGHRTSIAGQ